MRRVLVYRPDDPNNLLQQWPQKDYNAGIERIQGYRYPAPGSRPEAHIPTKSDDEFFDTKKYSHDPRNVKTTDHTYINMKEPFLIDENALERKGSQNRKENPAVMSYDPTGLRATVTATWAALDAAIEKNAVPDHLPHPEWEKDAEKIANECIRKGIPIRIGRRPRLTASSGDYNKIKW